MGLEKKGANRQRKRGKEAHTKIAILKGHAVHSLKSSMVNEQNREMG